LRPTPTSTLFPYTTLFRSYGDKLCDGGTFTQADGLAANRIALWNGPSWSTLGMGLSSNVNAIACVGSTLFVGGTFTNAGGTTAKDRKSTRLNSSHLVISYA